MSKKSNVMRNKLLFIVSFVALTLAFSGCDSEQEEPEKVIDPGDIDTFAGVINVFGHTNEGGNANEAQIGWVTGVAVDQEGNVYFSDGAANTIHMVTINDGKIRTVAGKFIGFNASNPTPFAGDGGPAVDASLMMPQAVTVDASGNVVISDAMNGRLRYVASSNNNISTVAGNGDQGYEGDGEPATDASMWNPFGISTDAAGNIYFADSQNNVIRKITKSTGVITTVAGLGPDNAGFSGDNGPATSAKLNRPVGVAVGTDGSFYISDSDNGRIRKVDANGTITTIAGTGESGFAGDGSLATTARFLSMKGIAVDSDDNVYICDAGNNVIRKVTAADGKIQTIAGTPHVGGFGGDGGPATEAMLKNPWGVAVDHDGNVFIADTDNAAIRIVVK
jgi:sugar lactone lactonase YvrE